jgi:hypothetical protein
MAESFFPSSKARELTVVSETPASSEYARATVSSSSIPAIHRISVSLPDKSTAILPNAPLVGSGHLTGMDWKPLLALIDEALAAKKMTDNSASKAAGHNDAIRNMRRKARGEQKGGVTFDTVFDVAKALDISPLAVCKVAMGYSADADDYEVIRQQVMREVMSGLQAQIGPLPQPTRKRRTSSR